MDPTLPGILLFSQKHQFSFLWVVWDPERAWYKVSSGEKHLAVSRSSFGGASKWGNTGGGSSLNLSYLLCYREYRSRFTNTETLLFCMRVMVGVIILYDHVHPVGAFAKTSKIDVSDISVFIRAVILCLSEVGEILTSTSWCFHSPASHSWSLLIHLSHSFSKPLRMAYTSSKVVLQLSF